MSTDQQVVKNQLWSIERVIAFVVAPIATPLSGFAAAWLAKHGVHIKGDAIYAFAGSASLGTAGSFITWLVGRQKFTQSVIAVESGVGHLAAPIYNAIPPAERESLLKEVESLVRSHIESLGGKQPYVSSTSSGSVSAGSFTVGTPEPSPTDGDPWSAPHDPAPLPEPVAAPQPVQPAEADAGAAITGA